MAISTMKVSQVQRINHEAWSPQVGNLPTWSTWKMPAGLCLKVNDPA